MRRCGDRGMKVEWEVMLKQTVILINDPVSNQNTPTSSPHPLIPISPMLTPVGFLMHGFAL
jgi:hypothetical protein